MTTAIAQEIKTDGMYNDALKYRTNIYNENHYLLHFFSMSSLFESVIDPKHVRKRRGKKIWTSIMIKFHRMVLKSSHAIAYVEPIKTILVISHSKGARKCKVVSVAEKERKRIWGDNRREIKEDLEELREKQTKRLFVKTDGRDCGELRRDVDFQQIL